MARAWREEYKWGIYHVIARGKNKEYIFNENTDKGYFTKQLIEYKLKYEIGAIEINYTLSEIRKHIGI